MLFPRPRTHSSIAEAGAAAPRNIPPSALASRKLTRVARRQNQPMTSGV
jgi:hypothetical protein